MSRLRWHGVVFISIVLMMALVLAVGCQDQHNDVSPTAVPSVAGDFSLNQFPLDEFGPTPEEQARLDFAWELAVERCLERFGIALEAVPHAVTEPLSPVYMLGPVEESSAKLHGYAPAPPVQSPPPKPVLERLPPDAVAVFTGRGPVEYHGVSIPIGGCRDEATSQVAPGIDQTLVGRLTTAAARLAEEDPRFGEAVSRWSGCMLKEGYRLESPSAAVAAWSRSREQPVTPAESATAVADVTCKQDTGLVPTWVALNVEYQNRMVMEQQGELERNQAAIDTALAKLAR